MIKDLGAAVFTLHAATGFLGLPRVNFLSIYRNLIEPVMNLFNTNYLCPNSRAAL